MKRSEYLDSYSVGPEGTALHRQYYAQYVTEGVIILVRQAFDEARLVESATVGRESFNEGTP